MVLLAFLSLHTSRHQLWNHVELNASRRNESWPPQQVHKGEVKVSWSFSRGIGPGGGQEHLTWQRKDYLWPELLSWTAGDQGWGRKLHPPHCRPGFTKESMPFPEIQSRDPETETSQLVG